MDTELTNEIIAINIIESRNDTVSIMTLMTPTIDITTALVASNETTLSAVVGPLINLSRHINNAIPNITRAEIIKIESKPVSSCHLQD